MDWKRWLPNAITLLLAALMVITQQVWAGPIASRLTAATTASSKTTINYQGYLTDSSGDPVNETVDMVFRLYRNEGDPVTEAVWEETQTGVLVSNGLFSVLLGSVTDIPTATIANNASLWLGIAVGGDEEMSPREKIASSPYAMLANVPDSSITSAKLADNAVTSAKIQDGQVGSADLANNAVTSAKIQDGQVSNADLSNNAVTSSKIQDGQVSNADLANNAVTSANIQDGQVSNSDVGFNYAGSSSKGGPASNVDCSNCISSDEIDNGQVKTADLASGAVTAAKINIDDHLDMNKKNIFDIGNLVFPYDDARAIKYRGSGPYGLAIQTVNDSGQDVVRMELGVGNYPNIHITNARLNMNGNPIINQGAMIEAGLQTADELAAERIDRFEQGDVLCWAGKQLEKCDRVNDRRVVAVADENGKPIVIGAEPIKVLGPVQVGDLLVASDVPGYATVNNRPAQGTTIAKALEAFDGEKGTVKAMIRTP